MLVSVIVAVSENGVIGRENQLPWRLPADLLYFKQQTWGLPVLMGRKTFESMGKPLPGRTNIVITRQEGLELEGARVVSSWAAAISAAEALDVKQVFVIGGAEIFALALPLADRLFITRIHQHFEGDVFFPAVDESLWKLESRIKGIQNEKNLWPHDFEIWVRK